MFTKPKPHDLKKQIKAAKITLWQLRSVLHISESKISRYLSGIDDPMPEDIEAKIKEVLNSL